MSKFKSLKQQSAEKLINALFVGLDEDINLRTTMEVMYGLRPESDLEELANINRENISHVNEKMNLTFDTSGNPIKISNDIINGDN